jgi:hypothetical protein
VSLDPRVRAQCADTDEADNGLHRPQAELPVSVLSRISDLELESAREKDRLEADSREATDRMTDQMGSDADNGDDLDLDKGLGDEEELDVGLQNLNPRNALDMALDEICHGSIPTDLGPLTPADKALELWNDRERLRKACASLSVMCKNKDLDPILRARLTGMLGVLNLYLDPDLCYTWRKSSVMVSKIEGKGVSHARMLRQWILEFAQSEELPLPNYSHSRHTILDDEDITQFLQLQITAHTKGCYLTACSIIEVITSAEVQDKFSQSGITKPTISERTARRWLQKLNWRYGPTQHGMCLDGHERPDVVAYRQAFVGRWKEYEKRFHLWDNDGNPLPLPNGFPVSGGRFRLILVTHDESTFYQNDLRKTNWAHASTKATPRQKGDGQSLMVSDFLTSEWGCLRDGEESVKSLFMRPTIN